MKQLDKVIAAGYSVHDNKRENGARIITIQGKGAWVRCVFRAGGTLQTAKLHIDFLNRSIRNLLQK